MAGKHVRDDDTDALVPPQKRLASGNGEKSDFVSSVCIQDSRCQISDPRIIIFCMLKDATVA
jgi:hypothetical protein